MNWLRDFAEDHREMGRSAFLSRFSHPFLVIRLLMGSQATAGSTQRLRPDDAGVEEAALEILPIRSGTETGTIRLGRSRQNELVLRSGFISSHHARFEQSDDGNWTVTDLGSKNGTAVAFRMLCEGEPAPLRNGTQVIFGGAFQATFYTNEGLWDHLEKEYWE